MLKRRMESVVYENFTVKGDKVLIVTGARQVGKSYIIRHVAKKIFKNVIEINLIEDFEGNRLFDRISGTDDFYFKLSMIAGDKLGSNEDTLVFLDEIQQYPQLLTMLKFLREENRFKYAVSGSLLGVSMKTTTSVPLGSVDIVEMYPLDFEEFLWANGVGETVVSEMKERFVHGECLDEASHNRIMELFKRYLLVGGLPEAVNEYIASKNIVKIREVQSDIYRLYGIDASKYDESHRLKIRRIYDMIPSNMENKKKRLVYKDIDGKSNGRADNYVEEIDYLISSGIALEVKAVSNPTFPLIESGIKNLLKLYLNDVGLMSWLLYRNNIKAVLDSECSVNLGSLYECVAATELRAHGNRLFYYDNKSKGEVDYLVDDFNNLEVLPIEIKSGKDYTVHSALNRLISTPDYRISRGIVFSNEREVYNKGSVSYMPIYYVIFINGYGSDMSEIIL